MHVKGEAQILDLFQLRGKSATKVAGCKIMTGTVLKENNVKIIRKGDVLYDGMFLFFERNLQ
jgi:translation initiation factor IF-2